MEFLVQTEMSPGERLIAGQRQYAMHQHLNLSVLPRVSFDIYKKTDKEKDAIKAAKLSHKHASKVNGPIFNKNRNDLIDAIIGSQTPRWGNVSMSLFRY